MIQIAALEIALGNRIVVVANGESDYGPDGESLLMDFLADSYAVWIP